MNKILQIPLKSQLERALREKLRKNAAQVIWEKEEISGEYGPYITLYWRLKRHTPSVDPLERALDNEPR